MSGPGNVRFDLPSDGLSSPSHSPNFLFDLTSSANSIISEVTLEKEKAKDLSIPKQQEASWTNRPKSTPWTSRPQALKEKLKLRWWRDVATDTFSILMPLPFLLLAALLFFVNGRKVGDVSFTILDEAIKAVCFPVKLNYIKY